MARPKYRAHPDGNQAEIIDGLLSCGYVVVDASQWADVFDLLVYGWDNRRGFNRWQPVECKTATGRLTESQEAFMDAYPGAIVVARYLADVLVAYGRMA